MMMVRIGALVIAAAALVAAVALGRYTIVMGARADSAPPAYRLDRLTGEVHLLAGPNMVKAQPPAPKASNPFDMFDDLVPKR